MQNSKHVPRGHILTSNQQEKLQDDQVTLAYFLRREILEGAWFKKSAKRNGQAEAPTWAWAEGAGGSWVACKELRPLAHVRGKDWPRCVQQELSGQDDRARQEEGAAVGRVGERVRSHPIRTCSEQALEENNWDRWSFSESNDLTICDWLYEH